MLVDRAQPASATLSDHLDARLRAAQARLNELSLAYTETDNTPSAIEAIGALGAIGVHAAVRYAGRAGRHRPGRHVIAAAAAEAAAARYGAVGDPAAVTRAARGRADAYACRRPHQALANLTACSGRRGARRGGGAAADGESARARKAVLEFRRLVRDQLEEHDRSKARRRGARPRKYVVQTVGGAAAGAAGAAAGAGARRGLAAARGALRRARAAAPLCGAAGDGGGTHGQPLSFEAASAVARFGLGPERQDLGKAVLRGGGHCGGGRLYDDEASGTAPPHRVVQPLAKLRTAANAAAERWPPADRFYGRDYAHTDRKDAAKRQKRAATRRRRARRSATAASGAYLADLDEPRRKPEPARAKAWHR